MPRAARLAAAAVAALMGCATVAPPTERQGPAAPPRERPGTAAPAADEGGGDAVSESDLPETAADAPSQARSDGASASDLRARLVERARGLLGRPGPFRAAGDRFNGDCSGFVQAVYAAEGIDLRGLMQETAPRERGGVKAAWLAARTHGSALGAEARPEPGDLVFWHDTYDRNRNRKADDRFTHLGIVEHVEDGTVFFLHRGGKGVARGVMTLGRRREASAADGRRFNSVLRARSHPVKRGGLAGQLFAGYGRIAIARASPATAASASSRDAAPEAASKGGRAPATAAGRVAPPTGPTASRPAIAAAKAPGARPRPNAAAKASRSARLAPGDAKGAPRRKKAAPPETPAASAGKATPGTEASPPR